MSVELTTALALILAYVAGSIPFGLLIGRVFKGIDIRQHGSGNIGATNVLRVLGVKWGALAFVLDFAKGWLPVWLLPKLVGTWGPLMPSLAVWCGLAAVVGHMFPVWLGFRGGKGVATALGVVTTLSPICSAIAGGMFIVTLFVWRIVSLSSMLGAASFSIAHLYFYQADLWSAGGWPLTALSLLIPGLILWRHRTNFQRLLQGREPRIFSRPSPQGP